MHFVLWEHQGLWWGWGRDRKGVESYDLHLKWLMFWTLHPNLVVECWEAMEPVRGEVYLVGYNRWAFDGDTGVRFLCTLWILVLIYAHSTMNSTVPLCFLHHDELKFLESMSQNKSVLYYVVSVKCYGHRDAQATNAGANKTAGIK